jgi:hypothetical protein
LARALDMDPENVNAMVGTVILDTASLDDTSREYCSKMENHIKLIPITVMPWYKTIWSPIS